MRLRLIIVATVLFAVSGITARGMSLSDMREWLMKTNGFAMLDLKKILEKGEPFDSQKISKALETIGQASRDIPKAFPPGSEHVTLQSSLAIWENPGDFESKVKALVEATEKASRDLPKTTSELTQLLNTLSSDCGDCHKTYRLKE